MNILDEIISKWPVLIYTLLHTEILQFGPVTAGVQGNVRQG